MQKNPSETWRPTSALPAEWQTLVQAAVAVRAKAYAPYSNYAVGCALLDELGRTHLGCNVENCSYGSVLCAERVAMSRMIVEGGRRVAVMVVVTSSAVPGFPCGACLQVLAEFGAGATVLAVDKAGAQYCSASFENLFPYSFKPEHLR